MINPKMKNRESSKNNDKDKFTTKRGNKTKKKNVAFEAVDYEAYGDADGHIDKIVKNTQKSMTLGERLALKASSNGDKVAVVQRQGASRSTSFVPKSSKKAKQWGGDSTKLQRGSTLRRSMKDIHK